MENDLISRQKLIDDLEAWRKRLDRRVSRFDDMVLHALPAVFDLVNEQETVEAEPVRHGWWDDRSIAFCNVCSECHVPIDRTSCFPRISRNGIVQPVIGALNYCPNCGAKMDAKEDDHG